MLVIAHRGANREALENSWSAFELAVQAGAQRIELDVQMSRDGHGVILHDDDLFKMTGRQGKISQLTRSELARIKLTNDEPLPFLDEVVARLLPRIELNIEIKGPSEAAAALVSDLVRDHPRREQVIVSSFCAEPLVWIYRHAPDITRACLWSSDTFQWPFFATLAPQVFLEKAGTNLLHPIADLVDRHLMEVARLRGWRVYAWVPMVGEEGDRDGLWASLKTVGLDGLCTNYPRQLRRWLEEAALDEQQYVAHQ